MAFRQTKGILTFVERVFYARIIHLMRINLVTPYAEKDAVKALGARWDATKKLWYIVDVTDLTPFNRWLPQMDTAVMGTDADSPPAQSKTQQAKSINNVPHCGCDVRPWDDCVHTLKS